MAKLIMGTDPEFMLVDEQGHLKSAIGIVQGTKENKIDLGGGNKLFYDNVLAEVNINPGDSAEALFRNVYGCLHSLARAVYPCRLRPQASATYPAKECQHEDAQVFGCEPEFCAYDMNIVQAPECKTTFRSAGGHIHLGYAEQEYPLMAPVVGEDEDRTERDWGRVWVVRMMDLFMGIPSLWMDQDPTSPARRKLYGKAGTHRPKEEYGVEYRATSNFWLRSPAMVKLAYGISEFVVNFVKEKKHLELWENEETCKAYDVEALREAINNSDKEKAKTFLNGLCKKYMPGDLYGQVLVACEPQPQQNFFKDWEL